VRVPPHAHWLRIQEGATVGPGTLSSHAILSFDGLPSGFGSDNRGLVPAIPAIACFMGHTWSKRYIFFGQKSQLRRAAPRHTRARHRHRALKLPVALASPAPLLVPQTCIGAILACTAARVLFDVDTFFRFARSLR
jgi:hypothetical protein